MTLGNQLLLNMKKQF